MFCPKCKDEYREGFTQCANCHISLVPELPVEEEYKNSDFTEIYITTDKGQIAFIKSILESEDIPYFIDNETLNVFYATPSKVMVPKKYIEKAKDILKDII